MRRSRVNRSHLVDDRFQEGRIIGIFDSDRLRAKEEELVRGLLSPLGSSSVSTGATLASLLFVMGSLALVGALASFVWTVRHAVKGGSDAGVIALAIVLGLIIVGLVRALRAIVRWGTKTREHLARKIAKALVVMDLLSPGSWYELVLSAADDRAEDHGATEDDG